MNENNDIGMRIYKWILALAAAGIISSGLPAQAEESQTLALTSLSSTTLSGYVSSSVVWKFGTGNALLPGRSYDGTAKQDGFNLDVVKLRLARPLTEAEWAAGYKFDVLLGPDAAAYEGVLGAAADDLVLEQAYVNLLVPFGHGIDFKAGVFDTCIGYEVFDSGSNPNFSRSYGYSIEPIQHTGILASYQVADWLAVSAGVANTLNSAINERPNRASLAGPILADESEKTYLGLVTFTAPDSFGFFGGATLSAGVVDGLNGAATATVSDQSNYYVGATVPTPLESLRLGASYDYRSVETLHPITGAPRSTYANATALYFLYQATPKLKLNLRSEFASGSAGTWLTPKPVAGPNNEQFIGITATAEYSLWDNVLTRAEFRFDRDVSGGPKPFGGTGVPAPAGAGLDADRNAYSLALNFIYLF